MGIFNMEADAEFNDPETYEFDVVEGKKYQIK